MAEDNPSGICANVHFKCARVTSPVPVGSTQTALPPRPLSEKARPLPKAGEEASPWAEQDQIIWPFSGSTPWMAFEALTSICFLPFTLTTTGVLCANPTWGRFASQRTAPVLRWNAMILDVLLF